MSKKKKYDSWIGLQKTLKNAGFMFALPALIYILQQAYSFAPDQYIPFIQLLSGGLTYFYKNYRENKD